MADGTKIEWTDATWQIVTGCSVVSPGCTNCYAMKLAGTRLRNHPSRADLTVQSKAGPVWNGKVRFNVGWLRQPLQWTKPRRIFVAAHGDLFHDAVQDWMLVRTFAVMAVTPQHIYQVLTKRAARMRAFMNWLATKEGQWDMARAIEELGVNRFYNWPLPNVWLGVSVEDQPRADERIPLLLQTPAAVRWISAEPLLGPLDLYNGDPDPRLGGHRATKTFLGEWWAPGDGKNSPPRRGVDWVVAGGESGPAARPAHPDWFRSLRDQCVAAEVPFFFKQWGAWQHGSTMGRSPARDAAVLNDGRVIQPTRDKALEIDRESGGWNGKSPEMMARVGKKAAGATLDGREWREMPT